MSSAAHTSKVRIYDLAKELKLESKRLIEEVRREGYDVSVPSNTVPKDLADKIRNRYFPKQETKRAPQIRVVKKQRAAEEGGEDIHVSVPPAAVADDGALAAVAEAPTEDAGETKAGTVRLVKRPLAPAARAEHPGAGLTGGRSAAPARAELS